MEAAETLSPDCGLYLYCLIEAATPPVPLRGLDAFPVRRGALAALVSEVALSGWREQELTRHLDDPGWVKERVERHDAVVRAALRHGPVIPARFGTIFTTACALRELLDASQAEASAFLDFVRDKQEWGIKVFARRDATVRLDGGQPEDRHALGSGKDYLLRKQQQKRRREMIGRASDGLADEIHARLAALSARAQRNVSLNGRTAEEEGEMILNAAFLVERAALDTFLIEVDAWAAAHQAQGITVNVTGPWAPYNFCPPFPQSGGAPAPGGLPANAAGC